MFSKTSSIEFLKYGEVFSSSTSQEPHKDHNHIITIENEKLTYFFRQILTFSSEVPKELPPLSLLKT